MNKLAIFCTILFASGLATVKLAGSGSRTTTGPDVIPSDENIQARVVGYRCFKKTFDTAVDELARGVIPLREAQTRVLAAARHFNPTHLEHVRYTQPGQTDEERVACNLVDHVRSLHDTRPEVLLRFPDLENELCDLTRDLSDRSSDTR